jgi:hypothetical protein
MESLKTRNITYKNKSSHAIILPVKDAAKVDLYYYTIICNLRKHINPLTSIMPLVIFMTGREVIKTGKP